VNLRFLIDKTISSGPGSSHLIMKV